MRIAVFGTGGVGATFGGYLAHHGADVTFIARGENLAAIRSNGLRLRTDRGVIVVHPAQVTDTPSDGGVFDVVLLCTKAWHVEGACEVIDSILADDGFVLPLQNAIEAPSILMDRLGDSRVMAGCCYTFSYLEGPGQVHVAPGSSNLLVFGEMHNKRTSRLDRFVDLVERTDGIVAEVPNNIAHRRWKKFVWISTSGLIGAVTRMPVGVWREARETQQLFDAALSEAIAVANANNAEFVESDFQSILEFRDTRVPNFRTSMQRDIMAGVPSELEYQAGSIVRLGVQAEVPTPVTESLYSALLPLERVARGKMTVPSEV